MSEESQVVQQNSNPYLMPGAVLIAGIFIAGAIFVGLDKNNQQSTLTGNTLIEEEVLPISEDDHIFGSKDADVFLIEYSDYKCGYCGIFHETIRGVVEKNEGRVAWVYRHTPYQPGGKEASIAGECVAEFAGEDAFWEFTELALTNQRNLSEKWYLDTAKELGVDEIKFSECVSSGKYDDLISKQTLNAQGLGSQGTPYSVLLTKDGGVIKFAGAQPAERVDIFVNRAFNSLN